MATLGALILLTTFVVCIYAAAASIAGARRSSDRLVDSGIGALYLTTALMTVASGIIVHAFVVGDYTIRYVQHTSDSVQPLFYKITSYWGGLDGSIMFWVFLLSVFGAIAVAGNRQRYRELIPYVVAIIAITEAFFLFLMVIHRNPFDTFLTQAPAEGRGLSPLLQNPYMVIHPPSLYTGFVGMTIPYAFGMAALITGHLDDAWLRAVRRWTMVSWLVLTFGLTLGMIWAYEELGWGGYWGWDPVENAALLPWFTATAFLHSVIVQERRSMLRVWNVTLVIVTFMLTIFGTFMTRSGVVQSVHAFGEDRQLAYMFTTFMIAIAVISFGYVIYRLPLLRSRHELDSWASREAAFLVNNWILLFAALFVLFATMFPTLSEAVTGERLTVGPPFFNKWMTPIGLILLLLTGVAPLLAWRKTTLANLRDEFLWPTAAMVGGTVALLAVGVRVWSSGICFAMCFFVTASIVQEFWRGARVRQEGTGTDLFTAMIGLVNRNKRRYGGYVVHLGIVLAFLGFAGDGFKREEQVLLKPGQETTVGHFTVRLDSVDVTDDGQKQMITGHLAVFEDGKAIGHMYPGKWFFRRHEEEPTTEVAIRRSIREDLYIVMPASDLKDQSASLHIVINPLVNWIWIGFGIIALGTGIALMPETVFGFATARLRMPEAANTTTSLLVLFMLTGLPALLHAQHMESGTAVPVIARTPLERNMQKKIICMCGTCGRQLLSECTCSRAVSMRAELSQLVSEGKTEQQIVEYYLAKYGSQEPLASPIDTGFNRLAWAFPYLLGTGGLVLVGTVALRWSRRSGEAAKADAMGTPASSQDAALEARLDDELRDLD
jgi:cytochrome c-type biogenesis protein CcmF